MGAPPRRGRAVARRHRGTARPEAARHRGLARPLHGALRRLRARAAFSFVQISGFSKVTALAGASLIVVLIGFAGQRFLTDIIAGFLMFFEGWFSVGDTITVEPWSLSGVVEELSLRSTTLRAVTGETIRVNNSAIYAARVLPKGVREVEIELMATDADDCRRVIEEVARIVPAGPTRFVRRPEVIEVEVLDDQLVRVLVHASVAHGREWLVEKFLPDLIKERAPEGLSRTGRSSCSSTSGRRGASPARCPARAVGALAPAHARSSRPPVEVVHPAYGGGCFADIPGHGRPAPDRRERGRARPSVLGTLDRRWKRVVLVVVDAFGWSCAERHAEHPFLRRVALDGRLAQLTSQFPSTTSAHMTTLHTGLPVGTSAIYEWFQLEPSLDAVIAPLLFSYAGDAERETLRGSGLDPAPLYPATTVYERLSTLDVVAHPPSSTRRSRTRPSAGRRCAGRPSVRSRGRRLGRPGGRGAARARPGLRRRVCRRRRRDRALHGPASDAHVAAATGVLDTLESSPRPCRPTARRSSSSPPTTARCRSTPATTVFVNEAWPEIMDHLRRGAKRPAAGARRIGSRPLPPRPSRPRR